MTKQHPVIPPEYLMDLWDEQFAAGKPLVDIIKEVSQWASDTELEACCEWLQDPDLNVDTYKLRAARRPKPPSLAELALTKTNAILNDPNRALLTEVRKTLEINRTALERLKELEQNG